MHKELNRLVVLELLAGEYTEGFQPTSARCYAERDLVKEHLQ
jgi:hypothetical protein